jgi:hypothetical protein
VGFPFLAAQKEMEMKINSRHFARAIRWSSRNFSAKIKTATRKIKRVLHHNVGPPIARKNPAGPHQWIYGFAS